MKEFILHLMIQRFSSKKVNYKFYGKKANYKFFLSVIGFFILAIKPCEVKKFLTALTKF